MTGSTNSGRRYMAVAETLREMLERGRWQAGERLPPQEPWTSMANVGKW